MGAAAAELRPKPKTQKQIHQTTQQLKILNQHIKIKYNKKDGLLKDRLF